MSVFAGIVSGVVGGIFPSIAAIVVGLRQIHQMKSQVHQMKRQIDKMEQDKEEDIRIEMRSLLSEIKTTYDLTQEPAGAENIDIYDISHILSASYIDKIANSSGTIERARPILSSNVYGELNSLKSEAKEFLIDARHLRSHAPITSAEDTAQQLEALQKALSEVNLCCGRVSESLENALGPNVTGEDNAS